jgi:hypothetical protein
LSKVVFLKPQRFGDNAPNKRYRNQANRHENIKQEFGKDKKHRLIGINMSYR